MYYFASDIHLGAGDEASAACRERRFVQWLDRAARDAQAIVLAGDIFDFWFEYENRVPRRYDRVLDKLTQLTARGIRIHFFTGNHDMWVLDYLQEVCGMILHTEPEVLEFAGWRIYVAHGDCMGFERGWLRSQNRLFRSKRLQALVRKLPFWLIEWLGCIWSHLSRIGHKVCHGIRRVLPDKEQRPLSRICDRHDDYVRNYAMIPRPDYFVFGHLHVARVCDELRIFYLGDWFEHDSYATLDERGEMILHNDPVSAP